MRPFTTEVSNNNQCPKCRSREMEWIYVKPGEVSKETGEGSRQHEPVDEHIEVHCTNCGFQLLPMKCADDSEDNSWQLGAYQPTLTRQPTAIPHVRLLLDRWVRSMKYHDIGEQPVWDDVGQLMRETREYLREDKL